MAMEQLIDVNRIGAVVFVFHILIETAEFLPPNHGKGCVQHVEISYLNVG